MHAYNVILIHINPNFHNIQICNPKHFSACHLNSSHHALAFLHAKLRDYSLSSEPLFCFSHTFTGDSCKP